jgi:hypothetical protein
MKTPLITDDQTLVSAASRFGHPVPIYDDGFGPLWVHRDSMGITGIIRAQTWEDAYGICEDEFLSECNLTIEEIREEYNYERSYVKMVGDRLGSAWEASEKDYENGKLRPGVEFLKWETVEVRSEDENAWAENAIFQECYGFRPNGPNKMDVIGHGIYDRDLNGDSLQFLTPSLIEALEITLVIKGEEAQAPAPRYFLWHESRFTNCNGRKVFSMHGRYGSKGSKVSPSYLSGKAGLLSHSHASPIWEDSAE